MLSEVRERFALAIVAKVPVDRIVEVHFFHPMRQGGVESGVAVLAAQPEPPEAAAEPALPDETALPPAEGVVGAPATGDAHPEASAEAAEPAYGEESAEPTEGPSRYTVYTARYRLVLKGPERGKWETSIVAEADAPLPTVDAVVRGVLRRAGDEQDAERISGEELRSQLHAASRT